MEDNSQDDWIDEMVSDNQNELAIHELTEQRDLAIKPLAEWCVSIERNGTSYKEVMYNNVPLRK